VFNGHVKVGYCLSLYPLGGVNHQQRSLAGSNGARHLIGKIDMPRGVNQVEIIIPPLMHIRHLDSVALYGDPPLTLEIHIIKYLVLKLPRLNGPGHLKKPVGKSALAMVYVRYYAKVAYVVHQPRGG